MKDTRTVPATLKATERIGILHRVLERRSTLSTSQKLRQQIKAGLTPEKIEHEALKRACRANFATFVKHAWSTIEPGRTLVWNWHVDVLCEALERVTQRRTKRLLITIPPGHMKSVLVSVLWPAWNWLEDPSWSGFFASYNAKLSERDARKCRDLISSEWYESIKPKVYGKDWDRPWQMKSDTNSVALYENEYRGGRTTTSVGGAGTGFRTTDLIIDDPMNMEERPTDENLEGIISWYDGRMSSRFNDMDKGAIVIIMQRLHGRDLAGYVLSKDEENKDNKDWQPFEHIMLPSEYEPDRACVYDRRTLKGELLFPERFSKAVIEEAKIKLGPINYSAQHRQDPIPAEGGLLPVSQFCFWYPPTLQQPPGVISKDADGNVTICRQAPFPTAFDTEAISLDCAFKDKKSSDYVALQAWGTYKADFYLIEQVHAHLSFTRTCEELLAMVHRRPKAITKYVEDKANGTAVMDHMAGIVFSFEAVDPQGGKESRAHAISPLIKAQNVWLPHPHYYPWVREFLKECTEFPLGQHDDQVDAMTQVLIKLTVRGMTYLRALTKMAERGNRGAL